MVAASILPVTINKKNELCFLFGKENPMEDSAHGYSDFGGRMDKNEKLFDTALREGSEELTGFLGNKKELKKMIKKNGGYYKLSVENYHIHVFYMDHDENLVNYYNNNHKFLWNLMDKNTLNDSKLFEKIEINWFTENEMVKRRSEFRNFYQKFLDTIIADKNIKKHVKKCKRKLGQRQTMKKRNN